MTFQECEDLAERVDQKTFTEEDLKSISAIIRGYAWILTALKESKIGLNKLRSFFGFSSKFKKKN